MSENSELTGPNKQDLTNSDTLKRKKLEVGVYILLTACAILIIAVIVISWQLATYNTNLYQNPFCLRTVCTEGKEATNVIVDIQDEPVKRGYATVNYCTVNAPPDGFSQAVSHCAANPANKFDEEQSEYFKKFINYYPNVYIPVCGYNWRSNDILIKEQNVRGDYDDPNNPYTLNGPNDDLIANTYKCATQTMMYPSETPGLAKLKEYCGTACQ
jgi:hypothetical protein